MAGQCTNLFSCLSESVFRSVQSRTPMLFVFLCSPSYFFLSQQYKHVRDPLELVLAADGAGCVLVLWLLLRVRRRAGLLRMPDCVVLLCPEIDFTLPSETERTSNLEEVSEAAYAHIALRPLVFFLVEWTFQTFSCK